MRRLVIIGEANPYAGRGRFASPLYHLPREASGNRLREHLGLHDHTYEAISKVNLCHRNWSMPEARMRVGQLLEDHEVLILLGAKVRDVFGGPDFFAWDARPGDRVLATLPHPSGRNLIWNQPGARKRARDLLQVVAGWVSWGEEDLHGEQQKRANKSA